jgi:Arylsulfotransferase (ASST)
MPGQWTRRQAIERGGGTVAGLGLAGIGGYAWPHPKQATLPPASHPASAPVPGVDNFVTRPEMHPPAVRVTQAVGAGATAQPPYIMIAPRGYEVTPTGQPGLMILDASGRLVWFGQPLAGTPLNFAMQQYQGQPVLTWSAGYVNSQGITFGTSYIADSSYKVIATVKAGDGAETDLHEFNLTPQGTALITAHRQIPANLTSIGGPKKTSAMIGVAQEIDVATGKVLFEWNSIDHVPYSESEQTLAGVSATVPYDYFHINSIAQLPDGDLLISSRNTWTVYKVSRSTGAIQWRLGGRKSDFTAGPGATYYWQHDARMPEPGLLTVFDNGSSPPQEAQSRALLLDLDESSMRVTLRRAYTHPAGLLVDNQGSVQLLPDGRVFVGWGAQPYLSEFAADGTLIMDGQLPAGDQSYRAFAVDWTGHPDDRPAVVAGRNPARGSAVYVSWNGATEVQTWTVLAGSSPSALQPVGSQLRSGFETMISVNSEGPYFAVTAQDAAGRQLGSSATVRRSTG